jgi:hypothetical protein
MRAVSSHVSSCMAAAYWVKPGLQISADMKVLSLHGCFCVLPACAGIQSLSDHLDVGRMHRW